MEERLIMAMLLLINVSKIIVKRDKHKEMTERRLLFLTATVYMLLFLWISGI